MRKSIKSAIWIGMILGILLCLSPAVFAEGEVETAINAGNIYDSYYDYDINSYVQTYIVQDGQITNETMNGKLIYDSENNVLTMNGISNNPNDLHCLKIENMGDDFTINLEENNEIFQMSRLIDVTGNLTIEGDGKLTLDGEARLATRINVSGDLTINNGTIDSYGPGKAINVDGTFTQNGGIIILSSGADNALTAQNILINGGNFIAAGSTTAMIASENLVTANGLTIKAGSSQESSITVHAYSEEPFVSINGSDTNTPEDDSNTDDVEAPEDQNIKGDVIYRTQVQNVGWQDWVADGTMAGTEGESLRLEGIEMSTSIEGLGIEYVTHIQNVGWEDEVYDTWKSDGQMSGTEGQWLRLEAIKIRLTGENAENYDVYYQVHAQNLGWLGLAKNGESAGTAGHGYRLEGIQIAIVPVGTDAPSWSVAKEEPFYENPLSVYPSIEKEIEDLNWKTDYAGQLYYYYEDLTNDGVDELIIGKPKAAWSATSGYPYADNYKNEIAFIYQMKSGSPVRILGRDGSVRAHYFLDSNNYIISHGSGGATTTYYRYYEIKNDDLNYLEGVLLETLSGKKYTLLDKDENGYEYSARSLSETQAYEIFNKYYIKSDIDWTPLVY
ncbi:MAG: hypothetical protein AB7V37_06260 [Eubacteriaceae bacterium]